MGHVSHFPLSACLSKRCRGIHIAKHNFIENHKALSFYTFEKGANLPDYHRVFYYVTEVECVKKNILSTPNTVYANHFLDDII